MQNGKLSLPLPKSCHSVQIHTLHKQKFDPEYHHKAPIVYIAHLTTTHYYHLQHFKSSLRNIKFGVPQGSILGLILLLDYLKIPQSALKEINYIFMLMALI